MQVISAETVPDPLDLAVIVDETAEPTDLDDILADFLLAHVEQDQADASEEVSPDGFVHGSEER